MSGFYLYPDHTIEERVKMLQNIAVKKEMRNYARSLQDSEVQLEEQRFATDAMDKKKLEDELANTKKDIQERIKNIEARMDERLEKIKNRKVTISGDLYGIVNTDNHRMMFYDNLGELIESRDLLPQERQGCFKFIADAPDGTAAAFSDLPLATQEVVTTIVANQQPEGHTADGEAEVIKNEKLTNTFTHDEEGWEKMTDADLMRKYNTTDIAVIRTMTFQNDVWAVPAPEVETKPKGKRNANKN